MKYPTLLLTLAAGCVLSSDEARAQSNLLTPFPSGWVSASPRPALAAVADAITVDGVPALRMRAKGLASYGEWKSSAQPVAGERDYHFEILYRPERVEHEDVSVAVVLSWRSAAGKGLQRDYVSGVTPGPDGWRLVARTVHAPRAAASVTVELILRWTLDGSVVWKEPKLAAVEMPKHRHARIVTTRVKPVAPTTVEANRALMAETFDQAGIMQPDLVLFTETLVTNGVPRPTAEMAEPIPGPTTRMLSERARKYHAWVATSLNEVDGDLIYNTAVLIDREGRIVGKYRKVHLPIAEAEEGITPGRDYPVFDTDFGRVGMMVCWDNFFPEAARLLRLNGAEIILLPINGDGVPGHWDVITRARAIDNSVFLVASSQAAVSPSMIVDPNGRVLASTIDGLAMADIDLDKETRVWALAVGASEGEAKSLYLKERHPETYAPLLTAPVHPER
ncbi:MAG: ramA 5 [Verrucomicrobia bacterium]|nr:ramA 5 [Verrucomicrobiota bacterium]